MVRDTLIFVPTYNEKENVRAMSEQLLALPVDADVLFCDDASPDGTGDVLDEIAGANPRMAVMHRSGKLGIGSAHLDGIAYAYDHGYRRLLTMDCDFTHSPEDIPRMLLASDDADVVAGSRFQAADSLPGWTLLRRSLTRLGHFATRHLLGMSIDATGAFRVYRLDRVPRRVFGLVTERGYAFFFQSMFILGTNHCRLVEVPIVLPARTYGHSKMDLVEVSRSVEQLGRLFFARMADAGQFRLGMDLDNAVDSQLNDPQQWNAYWAKKSKPVNLAYDLVATIYRNIFIKANLTRTLRREFQPGAHLLHAGCGSGQVDADLHGSFRVTAVDISTEALSIYSRENPHAHALQHADILALPFADTSFDGTYNLGVVEHFEGAELDQLFRELARVTKIGGKVVVFWPHKRATSAAVLDSIHFVMNRVLGQELKLHPPEPSRVTGRGEVRSTFERAGLELVHYEFGPRDLFVQAIAVGRRR